MYTDGIVTGLYTSSGKKDQDLLDQLINIEDFNINFVYLGNRIFNSRVWFSKDKKPMMVFISEEEINRRNKELKELFTV